MSTTLKAPAGKAPAGETEPSRYRSAGFGIAVVGLLVAGVALVANLVAVPQVGSGRGVGDVLAWSFGVNTTALAILKLAIATVLIGILGLLRARVAAAKEALPALMRSSDARVEEGVLPTRYGPAVVGTTVPRLLPIHTMAGRLWAPMLAMGAMAVIVGLGASFAWAGDAVGATAAAWTQGAGFLGEGLLLGGIALLLGAILGSLRRGGAEVQAHAGVAVKTLKMPPTAKAFVVLMGLGLMVSVAQFAAYLVAVSSTANTAAWFAWLGPLREVGLGLILSGIVMALVTIGNVVTFQFERLKEIIVTGG